MVLVGTEYSKDIIMLHLAVNKEFTYLNYLSVMSAILRNKVTIWYENEPVDKYWDLVKKMRSISFNNWALPIVDSEDKVGGTDVIYLGELNDNYIHEALIDHKGLYEVGGEFDTKDMRSIRVLRPEVVTQDYIENSNTLLANLVKRVLLERVWKQ